jgi:threonine dehydratase
MPDPTSGIVFSSSHIFNTTHRHMMDDTLPGPNDIIKAQQTVSKAAHTTPVLTSQTFNERCGGKLYFKCENFQKVGAFKFRGAFNAIAGLPSAKGKQGILTHSSGNHAQAVALAASMHGYRATIVMPENAPKVKVNAVRGYGADVRFCEPTTEAREETAKKVMDETGATFIHPYNHPDVISGQGTAAKELLDLLPELDILIAPVGGGGLISGSSIWARHHNPDMEVIAAEPEWADDAWRSMQSGKIEPVLRVDTVADGLRTSLGSLTFQIIQKNVNRVVTVSEEAIVKTMRDIWERMKIVVEPSSAVPLAALLDGKVDVKGKKAGIILTGGNVDLDKLPWQS